MFVRNSYSRMVRKIMLRGTMMAFHVLHMRFAIGIMRLSFAAKVLCLISRLASAMSVSGIPARRQESILAKSTGARRGASGIHERIRLFEEGSM